MARKTQEELAAEQRHEKTLTPSAPKQQGVDRIDDKMPLVDQAPRMPSKPAVSTLTAEEQKKSMPKQWRVVKDVRVVLGTGLAILRANKVIDERTYNLHQLRQQGAELVPVEEK